MIGHGAPFWDIWVLKYGWKKPDSYFYLTFALALFGSQIVKNIKNILEKWSVMHL